MALQENCPDPLSWNTVSLAPVVKLSPDHILPMFIITREMVLNKK